MCRMKSMILLKDKVYCPKHNSHLKMLNELNIKDDSTEPDFVKIEIIPPNNNVYSPIKEWIYCVDQDFLPEWYTREIDEPRCRKALAKWAQLHIRTYEEKASFNIAENEEFYLKNCLDGFYIFDNNSFFKMENCENILVLNGSGYIYSSSDIVISGGVEFSIKNSSKINLRRSLKIKVFDSEISESSNSVIYAYGNSKINAGYGTIVIKLDPKVEVIKTDESAAIIERYNNEEKG